MLPKLAGGGASGGKLAEEEEVNLLVRLHAIVVGDARSEVRMEWRTQ